MDEQQSKPALITTMLDRSENFEPCGLIIIKSLANHHEAFQLEYWRSTIDFVRVFNDPDACIKHVRLIKGEIIFLIVDAELCEQTIRQTHELRQIYKIYIFNARNDTPESAAATQKSTNKQPVTSLSTKVAGLYTNLDELRTDLSTNLQIFVRNSDILSQVIEQRPQSQGFTFNRLKESSSGAFSDLITVLLEKTPNENGKRVFLEKCRLYYAGNTATLNMIDEFEQTYQNQNAVWWYTRNTFLYFLLNKSLRQQNMEMIIHLHFFLFDLHHQLSVTYTGTNPRTNIEKYYRGQIMTSEEIKILKEHGFLYGAIILNSFLSTTKDYPTALAFSGSGSYEKDDDLQSAVFIIELLPSSSNPMDKEYADITHLSACSSEQETLFTVTSILYVEHIEYNESEKTWFITLSNWSSNDCFSYGRDTNDMQQQQRNSINMKFIHVGRCLSEKAVEYNIFNIFDEERKNDPPVTEESFRTTKTIYYDALLQNLIINQFVYDVGVGSLAFMGGQIDIAAEYLLKAQTIENQMHQNDSDEILLLLYDTLGHVFREKCEYDLALQYYNASAEIDSTLERLDDQACIYKILGNHELALTLSSSFTRTARASDKRKDSMTNMKEWKLFVDYAAENKSYLSKHWLHIMKEYLEIGKVHAGISSKMYLYNNADYRLKGCELPDGFFDFSIDRTSLHVAIDSFQRAINIHNQFNSDGNSPFITAANNYMALTNVKLLECSV